MGRRHRASYARVKTDKKLQTSHCSIAPNLAKNLRLRQEDKIKVMPLADNDPKAKRPGELILLQTDTVPTIASITFSPIIDSLNQLQSSEGGDEIPDNDIMERFIEPYVASSSNALLKTNSLLVLSDESGKKLEFMVTHIGLESGDSDDHNVSKKKKKKTKGKGEEDASEGTTQ